MTGLLGGGHAIYFDAATGVTRNLDCFVAVPSDGGAALDELEVRFGEELVAMRSERRHAPSRASPRGSTSSGARMGACPGATWSSPRSRSPVRASA